MGKNVKCLLIDDDIDDHEIFKLALETIDESILCTCIDKSIHAIEKLKTDESFIPSIIFVDINMPVMNGTECLSEIKKIDHLKDVPVIFYSTFADPEKITTMKKLGAAGYFEKPADIDVLTEKLSALFNEYDF
jgi:response regulator RpfG family c-di-GMP phosphodiesterase